MNVPNITLQVPLTHLIYASYLRILSQNHHFGIQAQKHSIFLYDAAVVVISACVAAIPAALRVHNLTHWFHLALVVLVSACPCALILSTPVAAFCALTKAAMAGVLIKGSDHLEVLAKIKVVAFDKTGTITRGEFVVTNFEALRDDISFHTLLHW